MNFKNSPRFSPEVEQKLREGMARSRSNFQNMTRDIYPESNGIRSETSDQNRSDSNRIDQERGVNGQKGISTRADSSTPPQRSNGEVATDHVEDWDYQP